MIRKFFARNTGRLSAVRKSGICLAALCICVLLLGLMLIHAAWQRRADGPLLDRLAYVVHELELTDLCFFTEARYTRHLSQADRFSPFQDHPVSLEHFPTGSIAGPPAGLRRHNEKLD